MTCLDLFCGGGGAARGLIAGGVTRIVGIDVRAADAAAYPGVFIAADLSKGLPNGINPADFDVVWASPPCQRFSSADPSRSSKAPDMIAATRAMLDGHPRGIIENVPGAVAGGGLHRDVTITGPMVGLNDILRERVFELTGQERHWRMLPRQTILRKPPGGWKGEAWRKGTSVAVLCGGGPIDQQRRRKAEGMPTQIPVGEMRGYMGIDDDSLWRAGQPVSILTSAPGIRAQQRRRELGLPLRIPVADCRRYLGIPPGQMTRRQVGNAVPPAYARRVLEIVLEAWPLDGATAAPSEPRPAEALHALP